MLYCSVFVLIAPSQLFAQTSVTLYGAVDAGFSYQSHSANDAGTYRSASRFGMISGGQSGNRFGLKGNEQISAQTEINIVLENGFDIGNGTKSQGGHLFGWQARFETEDIQGFKVGIGYSFFTQISSAYIQDGSSSVVPGESRVDLRTDGRWITS